MILYNILLKKFPYDAKTREELKNQMETKSPTILIKELPLQYKLELGDFVNKLLRKNVSNRLGHKSIREIKLHAWIKDMPWGKIKRKFFQSPCMTNVSFLLF